MTEPNLQRIQLLVDALYSDDYQQGTGCLTQRDPSDTFDRDCCLGVGVKVAIANGCDSVRRALNSDETPDFTYIYGEERVTTGDNGETKVYEVHEGAVLPPPVVEWYGFDDSSPLLKTPNGWEFGAIQLNDELRWDFKQIGKAFEVTYLGGTYEPEAMNWPKMRQAAL